MRCHPKIFVTIMEMNIIPQYIVFKISNLLHKETHWFTFSCGYKNEVVMTVTSVTAT